MSGIDASARVSRRQFLAGAAGTGLLLGFHFPMRAAAEAGSAAAALPEINAWVQIESDERVIIRIARSEMGQGTLTGLAQLVAEELECDWSRVTTEYPTPGANLARNRVWGDFMTGGSRGIRASQEYVRKGGAAARMMLVQAAANQFGVPASECRVERGVITHPASNRRTTYGQVAAAAAKLEPPADVPLKDPGAWTVAGRSVKRLDTLDKLTGKQVFGVDLKLPGMLNAAIKDCPVFGGTLKSFDPAAVQKMPGVQKVVRVGDSAVAVVADTWWRAKTALDALPIVWDEGPNASISSADIDALVASGLDAEQAVVGNQAGDVKSAIRTAAKTVEAVYSFPFQNHATMEPMTATARWTPERCEVWCPTQNGEAALAVAIEASGLRAEQCDVHKFHLGGGFGRRGQSDYVRQAIAIARQVPGTPVKLIWTRQEDMLHGYFHPTTQCRLTGALDAHGNLTGLHMRISGQSILAALMPQNVQNGRDPVVFQGLLPEGSEGRLGYDIANLLIDHAMRNPHIRPGFWRGVNHNQNAIYLECFIDECAHAAGRDPLEFRRALMANHPRHLAALNAAAERAGWGKPAAPGVHRGLAQIMGFGSYVAAVAEVSVSAAGKLRIHRIVAATDTGVVVNPQQVEAQVEGSFVYGLSAVLFGACTVANGRIVETNFDTYPVMRMDSMPAVETELLASGGFWGGVGEPTIAVAGPAVLNAIFAATGKRIRRLPLKDQDIRPA
ncbi:MAG: molybdopterin cofactor-binding domain-containing protein [Gammaproteobacteria bacterium]